MKKEPELFVKFISELRAMIGDREYKGESFNICHFIDFFTKDEYNQCVRRLRDKKIAKVTKEGWGVHEDGQRWSRFLIFTMPDYPKFLRLVARHSPCVPV